MTSLTRRCIISHHVHRQTDWQRDRKSDYLISTNVRYVRLGRYNRTVPCLETVWSTMNTARSTDNHPSSEESVDRMLRFTPNFDLRKLMVPAPVPPAAVKLVTFFSRNLIFGSLVTVRVFTSQVLDSWGSWRSTGFSSLSTQHTDSFNALTLNPEVGGMAPLGHAEGHKFITNHYGQTVDYWITEIVLTFSFKVFKKPFWLLKLQKTPLFSRAPSKPHRGEVISLPQRL